MSDRDESDPNDIREALEAAGRRRAAAQRDKAEAMADIGRWVAHGQAAGLTVTEMARLAGVSRPTVYALLADGAAQN